MLYGVDVHDGYQKGLSFPTLVRQGYSFAAVKLTQGTNFQRDMGDDWISNARSAGLIAGAYHWLNSEPGAQQARWFWKKLQEVGGPEGLLIQCDNEDNATWQVTKDWAAEWEQLSQGHPFLMYTGKWWWGPRGWDGASLTPHLWHSEYIVADLDSIPDDPAAFAARVPASAWAPNYGGWKLATFLQFTSKGDAGGLANNVDLNATKLTREQLLALTTSGADMPLTSEDLAKIKSTVWYTDLDTGPRNISAGSALLGVYDRPASPPATVDVAALAEALRPVIADEVRKQLDATQLPAVPGKLGKA